MNVWLINPFDPLPGEEEQLGRYARLAYALRDAGHQVIWWSSDFSHRFKRPIRGEAVNAESQRQHITVKLVNTPPYASNVSFARIRNHRQFAKRLADEATRGNRPDIILASSPPLESAAWAAQFGRSNNIPCVIDIQDQWPDNFAPLLPPIVAWVGPLLLKPFYRLEQSAYTGAVAFTGVAIGYVDRGISIGGAKPHARQMPLGVDLAILDPLFEEGRRPFFAKTSVIKRDQFTLLYSGSLSRNYDVDTIVRAAGILWPEFGHKLQIQISGKGENLTSLIELADDVAAMQVVFRGFLPFRKWAKTLSRVDAGINAAYPSAKIYLPNKIFYYLAAGLPVLNCIPGECAELVESERCGINYQSGDPESCANAVRQLLADRARTQEMSQNSRRLAETRFDRAIISREFVRFLEEVRQAYSWSEA